MMSFIFGAAAAGSLATQGLPSVSEPLPLDESSSRYELRCGSATLRIDGFGAATPAGRLPAITSNGAPLSGDGVEAMRRDLADARSVYRLAGRCSQATSGILLHIYTGSPRPGGVEYKTAFAAIRGGRVHEYRPLYAVDAEAFWFR